MEILFLVANQAYVLVWNSECQSVAGKVFWNSRIDLLTELGFGNMREFKNAQTATLSPHNKG